MMPTGRHVRWRARELRDVKNNTPRQHRTPLDVFLFHNVVSLNYLVVYQQRFL
jgi:hypothetical protein